MLLTNHSIQMFVYGIAREVYLVKSYKVNLHWNFLQYYNLHDANSNDLLYFEVLDYDSYLALIPFLAHYSTRERGAWNTQEIGMRKRLASVSISNEHHWHGLKSLNSFETFVSLFFASK